MSAEDALRRCAEANQRHQERIAQLERENTELREIARALATDSLPIGQGDWAYCDFHKECGLQAIETKHGPAQRFVHVADCPVAKARKLLGTDAKI